MKIQTSETVNRFADAKSCVIDARGSGASNCTSLVAFLDGFWRKDFYNFCKKYGLTYVDGVDMSEGKEYDVQADLAYLDWKTQKFTLLTVYDRGGHFRIGGHDEEDCIELAKALGLPVRR